MVCIYHSAWRGSFRGHDAGLHMESGFRQRRHLERTECIHSEKIVDDHFARLTLY